MKMIQRIRESRTGRLVFTYLLLNIVFEIAQPTVSLALTSGPSQPEVQSFEPVGTTDMVDVFSGDFNYNVPLMNIPGPNGGYPVNLAYHAGISMDDEASWVGLGWNINNGALVRNVRGLPDDFDSNIDQNGDYTTGDFIDRKVDQKESVTVGAGFGSVNYEVFGVEASPVSWQFNLNYNNYRGLGYNIGYTNSFGDNSPFAMGLSLDSEDGLGVNVSYSFDHIGKRGMDDHNVSLGFNGNNGLTASLGKSKERCKELTGKPGFPKETRSSYYKEISQSRSSALTYTNATFSPSIGNKINSYSFGFQFLAGNAGLGFFSARPMNLSYSTEDYDNDLKDGKRYPVIGYEKAGSHSNDDNEYYTQDFTRQKDGMITRQTPVLGHSYYTNDAYNFTGQGIAGYFRGRRSDIGRIHDPAMVNHIFGLNGSLEFSATLNPIEIVANDPIFGGFTQVLPANGKKIGIGINFTYGWNSQGTWDTHNNERVNFKSPNTVGKKENFYYQVHGQPTVLASNEMNHIGGEGAWRPALTHVGMERGIDDGSSLADERVNQERVVRNSLVHSFHNSEMAKLPEFNSVKYYNYQDMSSNGQGSKVMLNSTSSQTFNRSDRPMRDYANPSIAGHNGGYKVLQEDGSYYVYGLPAYNTKEVNNVFSVDVTVSQAENEPISFQNANDEVVYQHDNTDKFINKTTQSPYAHSFMLTAIYGADYVDITQDGPTDDDLGYWVKFDYVKYTGSYKWRAPYFGAFLNKGAHHTTEDDKASYAYGEKEVWYLGRIETKTHTAVYHMSERRDNAEASGEFATTASPATVQNTGLKVDKISLYVKEDYATNGLSAKALQEVHFQYDYSSCPGVINNTGASEMIDYTNDGVSNPVDINSAEGKLTLRAIWFTAQGSKKGTFNKYKFNYDSGDPADNAFLQNPSYAFNKVNGWGSYKPGAAGNSQNKHFPYVDQFNQWPEQGTEAYQNDATIYEDATAKANFKRYQDQFASAWSLKRIELPSGGVIKVDYESDDYGYVQDQEATQMFKITDVNDQADGLDKLYDEGLNNFTDARTRRIYFKLEYPIPSATSDASAASLVYDKYVKNIIKDENGNRNLFFKCYVQLKDLDGGSNDYEAVSGYIPLETDLSGSFESTSYYHYGVASTVVNGNYTHGFVTVKQLPKKSSGNFDYHPISLMAWQYMQTNTPKLMHDFASLDDGSNGNFVQQLSNVLNVIPAFMSSVGATRAYARSRQFAQKIDLNRSVVRLCSPDKIKFGGGHRVRKISMTDSWSTLASGETDRTYGTEYDYTMKDTDGSTISSGVAQYEPSMAGDENALRYPLYFHGRNTFVSNNNLFAEHPFNEDLFPGASVGYRKVTVKSINTGKQLRNESPNAGRTGGVTVYSFYTAKEFPTIVDYTSFTDEDNDYKGFLNLPLPIPFIGAYYRKYYHGSQAFKIELNDMHGKPKSVESFELTNDYHLIGNPITSTTYEYQTREYNHNGHQVMRLHNKVKVVSKDNPTQLASGERDMGVEYDMFTDQRQTKSHIVNAGLEINLDIPQVGFPLVIPSFWPSFTTNKTLTRTYVTNKVIFKTGILKRTVSRDLQSSSSSEIVAYDELSGQPLISKGTNEFGDDIYSYNIPAYWNYDRMGHAYKNINYTFEATIQLKGSSTSPRETSMLVFPTTEMLSMLVRGDEVLFVRNGVYLKAYYADLTFDSSGNPRMLFYAPNTVVADFGSGQAYEGFQNYENPGGGGIITGRVVRSGRRNHYSTIAASYLTKGNVFEQIGGTAALVDGMTTPTMDNVLSASATLFRDDWDNSLTVDAVDGELASNTFLSGHAGIWRPYKSYAYAGTRTQSADMATGSATQDPDLRNDGLMMDVPMFSWDIGNMEDYQPKWEWASEISRYNKDSYEVENVDRLGIKSAALFGLGNNLSIAVGGNADYHEMGTMDFESSTSSFADPLGLTNMIFYNGTPSTAKNYVSETAKIKDCYLETDGSLSVFLDLESALFTQFSPYVNQRVGLGINSRKSGSNPANVGHFLNGVFDLSATQSYMDNGVSKVKLKVTSASLAHGAETLKFIKSGEKYYGRATFLVDRTGASHASTSGVAFSSTKAHTGKKSMTLSQNTSFLQKELRLKTGTSNKYVLSFWISRADANQYRFTTTGSDIVTLSQIHPTTGAATAVPSGTLKYTCSKVIEGWQKIDVTFSTDVSLAVLRLNFTPGANTLYVDDIRISPHTGGMTTNVYDPSTFRLRASLNVDNYATFYYYDEQGNLVLRKQETENGIVTLNEARGNVRKGQ